MKLERALFALLIGTVMILAPARPSAASATEGGADSRTPAAAAWTRLIGAGAPAVTSGYPETLLLDRPYYELLTTEEWRERVRVLDRLPPGTRVVVLGHGIRRGAHPYYRWYQVDAGRGRIGWVHHLELR
jgi:hypothetical protein